MEEDAYSEAVRMLVAGAMPFILPLEDGVHVVSVVPTSQPVLELMLHDDEQTRMVFLTKTAVAIHDNAAAL